jgi:hypothetical protein
MVAPATDRYLVASLEFEGVLRACLHRYARNAADVDELLQDTYAHLLAAGSQPREEIRSIRAFALTVARNVALSWLRHRQVVPIELVADLEQLELLDERSQVDEIVNTHQELALLTGRGGAVAHALPPGCSRCARFTASRRRDRRRAAHLREHGGTTSSQGHATVQRGARLLAGGRAALAVVRQGAPARGAPVSADPIELQASRWLASRDARPDDPDLASALDNGCTRTSVTASPTSSSNRTGAGGDRLRELRPLDRGVNPDLLRPPRRYWSLASAASARCC